MQRLNQEPLEFEQDHKDYLEHHQKHSTTDCIINMGLTPRNFRHGTVTSETNDGDVSIGYIMDFVYSVNSNVLYDEDSDDEDTQLTLYETPFSLKEFLLSENALPFIVMAIICIIIMFICVIS